MAAWMAVKSDPHSAPPVILPSALSAVVLYAKHLAVGRRGPAALVPGRDMISLHSFELEVFAAGGADAFLSLVAP